MKWFSPSLTLGENMKVFVDGEEIKVGNDVKVIWEGHVDGFHERIDNNLTLTSEGAILDKMHSDGTVVATQSVEADDLFSIIIGGESL